MKKAIFALTVFLTSMKASANIRCEKIFRSNMLGFSQSNIVEAVGNVDHKLLDVSRLDAWGKSYLPFKEARKSILTTSLQLIAFIKQVRRGKTNAVTFDELEAALKDRSFKSQEKGKLTFDKIDSEGVLQGAEIKSLATSLHRCALCIMLAPLNVLKCSKSFKQSLDLMTPKVGGLSLVPVMREMFTNSRYIEGARIAALKIVETYRTEKTESDLFTDIYRSYLEAGLETKLAESYTWDIIGVIATGGPNIGLRVSQLKVAPEFDSLKLSLTVIASAIPYLDSLTVASGHPYSMPKTIQSTIDLGKPYHFWMTAYLARKAAEENGNVKGAAAAAFILQKGYEMRSATSGRDPLRAFMNETFDPFNNVIRMDLAHSSAGAVYGAHSAKGLTVKLSLDEGLALLLDSAKSYEPLERNRAKELWTGFRMFMGFMRWQSIFAPDAAFRFQNREASDQR